jgi:hypothetical protein
MSALEGCHEDPSQSAVVLNRRLRFAVKRSGGEWDTVFMTIPRRGRAMRRAVVERDRSPGLLAAIEKLIAAAGTGDPYPPGATMHLEFPELLEMGVLIPPDEVSGPVAFEPMLVEPTGDERRARRPCKWGWRVADGSFYQPLGAPLPAELEGRDVFKHRGSWGGADKWLTPGRARVWIRDPGTEVLMPFGVPSSLEPIVSAFVATPDAALDIRMEADVWESLEGVGLVRPEGDCTERRERWAVQLEQGRSAFRSEKLASLSNMIHPLQIKALRVYLAELIANGYVELRPGKGYGAYGGYNETVCRYFHHELAGLMTRVAGEPVKPSYLYFRNYQAGDELPKHVDREPSHFSISVLVDYSPLRAGRSSWPLCFETALGSVVEILQAPGDALFFRGMELPHFRRPLAVGHASTSIIFEYVSQSFEGSLE